MKHLAFVYCLLSSFDLHALTIDISLTDDKKVRVEDVRARVKWFRDEGVEVKAVDVPNAPGAIHELRKVTEVFGTDDRPIESVILNVHESDRKQQYSLGELGVLLKDGPDDALRIALEPLVGRIAKDANVVIVSPSLRRTKFKELTSRTEAFMKFLGATEGSCTVVPRTPKAIPPRDPNASAYPALATFAGLVPLSLFSPWYPFYALPVYAVAAAGVVGIDRYLISERTRASLRHAVLHGIVRPAWRTRLRGGETFWAESVYLVKGFASIRSCAEGLAGRVRGHARR